MQSGIWKLIWYTEKRRNMKAPKQIKTLTVVVIICIMIVILYIITAIVLQCVLDKTLPDSLNQGVLLLFGSELAVSGFIKIFKITKE